METQRDREIKVGRSPRSSSIWGPVLWISAAWSLAALVGCAASQPRGAELERPATPQQLEAADQSLHQCLMNAGCELDDRTIPVEVVADQVFSRCKEQCVTRRHLHVSHLNAKGRRLGTPSEDEKSCRLVATLFVQGR